MDGYLKLVKELLELVFILASFANETFKAMLPPNLQKAATYAYSFLNGVGGWIGYAFAAGYFVAKEYDMGKEVCELSGYGYEAIDALQVLVSFTDKADAAKTT